MEPDKHWNKHVSDPTVCLSISTCDCSQVTQNSTIKPQSPTGGSELDDKALVPTGTFATAQNTQLPCSLSRSAIQNRQKVLAPPDKLPVSVGSGPG